MNIHLIAIGGSAMHNLALALHHKGYKITGSDDAIFSPSKERLLKYDLLPKAMGWFPEKITKNLDAIILGMHARIDNPEFDDEITLSMLMNAIFCSEIAALVKNKNIIKIDEWKIFIKMLYLN